MKACGDAGELAEALRHPQALTDLAEQLDAALLVAVMTGQNVGRSRALAEIMAQGREAYLRQLGEARRPVLEEVRIATVVNFPRGEDDAETVVEAIRAALAAGADEIDLVFPWRELRAGNDEPGRRLVSAAREACGEHVLKVILETGELTEADLIRRAARIAIESGADFLKTSTGKVPVNATPEAVRILLEAIRDSGRDVGCKVSGGIRTTRQAREYLGLAARIMGPDWISPSHFRFGASGLLDDLMATLGDSQAPAPDKDAY